tara:strand:- start:2101 stop:4269 length:2169 start_codon:yes stop_codon:yes gene_type:complete
LYLNKTEKLLFFLFLFLNFIPLNKAETFSRGYSSIKINDNKSNSDSKILNQSIKVVDKTINRSKNYIFSGDDFEINYSDKSKKNNFHNKIIDSEAYLVAPEGNYLNNEENKVDLELPAGKNFNNDEVKSNLLLPQENNLNNQQEIEIRSDSQSEKDNILYANGNVLVIYKGNILSADQIVYDKGKKIINAKGSVVFILKNNTFQADSINYDFTNESGNLLNVKGFINTENKISDLNFANIDQIPKEILQKIEKVKILYTPSKIRNWIFTTDNLIILKNEWFAKQAIFTNDLFESEQIKFKINSLKILIEEDLLRLRSGLNYLMLEEKVSIPFWLSEKTISTKEESELDLEDGNSWNIGYDKRDKDGYFIGRKYDPINLIGEYNLELQPQFFIQRSYQGYSNSFTGKGESITSDKIKRNTTFIDYFGLESKIDGKFKGWNHKVEKKINTFDFDKLAESLRVKLEISKEINFFKDSFNNKFYWVYRDRVWNGSQGEAEIYEGYGWKLEKDNSWTDNNISKNEYLSFGFGRYSAEELNSKNLTTSFKGSLFYKLGQRFPILINEPDSKYIDNSFKYLPEPMNKGIYLDTEISLSSSFYKNGIHQEYIRVGAGPEFIIGDFKNSAFDYTRLKLFPFYKITNGNSVFKFDQISDVLALDINLDQQLIGPILIKTYGRLNLNSDSDKYGEFTQSKVSLNWQRRSYEFGIFYQPHKKSGGVQFSIFGFE